MEEPSKSPSHSQAPSNGQTDNTKLFSVLAYIPFLWLIGLLADRKNPTVVSHVNQGIILTICSAVLNIAVGILGSILVFLLPILVVLTSLVTIVVSLVEVSFLVIGIINAVNGAEKPLPFIGRLFVVVK